MNPFNFVTVRLGKDSISDINEISNSSVGILENPFQIVVKCTQIPDNYAAGDYAFIWLGSDNNKGAQTKWKQGFKAVGKVSNIKRGASYNDTSETTLTILFVFEDAVSRMDILRCAPEAYYWCAAFPLIGLDDHANQTIRLMSGNSYSDIKAFFYAIDKTAKDFKCNILKVEPGFKTYFDVVIPSPKNNSLVKSMTEAKQNSIFYKGDNSNANVNIYLTALRTKPFMLLAGISGTGKSRIVRKLAQASTTQKYENTEDRWKDNRPENFELIQVKPNWHNSMDVVGYYSNVAKRYEFPPFIDFIVKAWQDLETPYFLCLDEMNLAPVEQYFAEFLSAIESRSFDADGNYVTDPIIKPFKKFGEKEGKAMLVQLFGVPDPIDKNPLALQFFEKGLTLPKNLLVMGTVNMDETTFSFSRKVLDRAMSVVMNEVDYESFFNGESENDVAEMDDATRKLLIDRPIRGLEAENNEADAVKEYLTKINEKLNDTPFKLGYRAANEALLYVSAAHKFNPDADIHVALDEFTMMKILSRIEGDKRSIGNLLDDLKAVITSDYPKSNEKLEKMAETLKNKQFVSYWT